MLTQHCDTSVDVVRCFLGQINVAEWSLPRAGTANSILRNDGEIGGMGGIEGIGGIEGMGG